MIRKICINVGLKLLMMLDPPGMKDGIVIPSCTTPPLFLVSLNLHDVGDDEIKGIDEKVICHLWIYGLDLVIGEDLCTIPGDIGILCPHRFQLGNTIVTVQDGADGPVNDVSV